MVKKRGPSAYTDDFRRSAVELVETGKGEIAELARQLGVHPETLRIWVRLAARRRAGEAASGRVLLEEENRRLRQENARLLEEREILKKAMAFFAKDAR
jgi:transposase